jgi:hypothetical protein
MCYIFSKLASTFWGICQKVAITFVIGLSILRNKFVRGVLISATFAGKLPH